MGSDKRGRQPHGSVAGRGPLPPVTGAGSVNRGFASVDPERQPERGAQDSSAAEEGGKKQDTGGQATRVRRAPATGGTAPPPGARSRREDPDEGGSG